MMLHSVLDPGFVDLISKEKIMVTSYTMFLVECTIRVIQVLLTCILWLQRVHRFEVLQLFVGYTVRQLV